LSVYYEGQSEPTVTFLATLPQRVRSRLPGIAVVMTSTADSIPPVLLNVVRRFQTLHSTVPLTTVTTEEVPYVLGERAERSPLGHGIHRLVLRFGFVEEPQVHRYVAEVAHSLEPTATAESVTYMLGHERLVAGPAGRMGRLAERFFATLSRNASNPSDYF